MSDDEYLARIVELSGRIDAARDRHQPTGRLEAIAVRTTTEQLRRELSASETAARDGGQ